MSPRRRRGPATKLLAGIALALLLLGSAELALVLSDAVPQDAYVLRPGIRWTLAPGLERRQVRDPRAGTTFTLSTDENGLRRTGGRRPEAKVRVMVLGCSIAFGWNLPDQQAMPARLQHHLDRLAGSGAAWVINGAQPGFSSLQSLHLLEQLGPRYAPDVVLLQVSPHNSRPSRVTDYEQLRLRPATGAIHALLAHSRLYRLLRLGTMDRAPAGAPLEPGGVDHALMGEPPEPAADPAAALDYRTGVRVPVAHLRQVRRQLEALAEARGFALVWTLPIGDRLPQQYARVLGLEGGKRRVRYFADQTAHALQRHPNTRLTLARDPGHWNATGSDAAAAALASYLFTRGLVPAGDVAAPNTP